jgi:hypothetical protein
MQMIMMREDGVKIPKSRLFDRKNYRYKDHCIINQMEDIYTRRVMSIAIFGNSDDPKDGYRLLDARLVWMNEDGRFMLAGIERRKKADNVEVEYAQSWLVFPNDDAPPMPEGR